MWELRAWGRGLWLGVALVFLFVFEEFEIATTWNMRAWPVALFDAQTGGLALAESFRLAALPFGIQAALVAVLALSFSHATPVSAPDEPATERSALALIVPLFAVVVLCLVPLFAIVGGGSFVAAAGKLPALESVPWRPTGNAIAITGSGASSSCTGRRGFSEAPASWKMGCIAVRAARNACAADGLLFLDDTVAIASIRLVRDGAGRLTIGRAYDFEYSDTGDNRRRGAIVMLGAELQDMQLEPYQERSALQ